MMINKLGLYIRTLRHLRMIQIINRIVRKFRKVKMRKIRIEGTNLHNGWIHCAYSGSLSGNVFTFLNHSIPFRSAEDWNSCTTDKLWLYNLHYFDFLKQEDFRAGFEAGKWLDRWITENPPFRGNGWEPYPLSLRIVNWIKWVYSGNVLSASQEASLALQADALEQQLEYHLLANHLMTNGKALIFAGTFFKGDSAERWLRKGWQIYEREIKEEILSDGGHFERSVMYHSIILEDLLDIWQLTKNEILCEPIRKMLIFLQEMCHPDRQIALFNDAASGIASSPDALFDYAEKSGFSVPLTVSDRVADFADSGYTHVSCGKWDLFADTCGIDPSYQPGHSHADTFTFELSCNGKRIVTDTGTSCYQGKERLWQRGTAAHNTVTVDDRNSSEIWSAHRVGARAKIIKRSLLKNELEACHNGFPGIIHRRKWSWDRESVTILDTLHGNGVHHIKSCLHFMPQTEVELTGENILKTNAGFSVQLPQNCKVEIEYNDAGFQFGKLEKHISVCCSYHGKIPVTLETVFL